MGIRFNAAPTASANASLRKQEREDRAKPAHAPSLNPLRLSCEGTRMIILLIVLLQVADIVTTVIALRRGGKELNPLARKLFGALGTIPAAILLKLIGSAPMVAVALLYPAYWMVPAAYAFVLVGLVAHNLFTLADQRAT